ncbi:hypothetical protein KIH86_26965 [Paenibacillus sp. HN-1]|uniref:DL-endopeptidase inhibitor IseA family protein n=1 Tax=Paenibacillus TaxID=44249 RepID=UPI001CA9BF37|nr:MULTISPECIES: DL-endopeptidase inhibitor IseA family protein [Paenibacillus]MBY9077564.1 hypothetical protein [Paenibacillus sp. CGMCC 1.18879]MBY9087835.1 hypothetical protein [Paenibacillus sinensis]
MNNTKWLPGLLALTLGLTPAAGGAFAASATTGATGTISANATAAATATGAAINPSMINNLTPATIIPLIVKAREIYFYTSRGGSLARLETFNYKEMEYRYISADIGTKQKLMHYVKQAYTHNAAAYYAQTQFYEKNGRMSQVNGDLGNLLLFEDAKARMVSKDALTAVFELTVPYPDNVQDAEKVTVKLKKVNGYWRIDMSPDTLF